MKEFLADNWFMITLLVAFAGYAVYLVITKQWTKLREQAYALMLTAERIFGDGEGKEKFEAVFNELYYRLIPAWLKLFVTPEAIRKKLQEWYDLAKEYLGDASGDSGKTAI